MAINTIVVVAAALGLLIWLAANTLPSPWWLAPAGVCAVAAVVLLHIAGVAMQQLSVTLQDGRLEIVEHGPLQGNRRLICPAADVLSVELGAYPPALRLLSRDGSVFEFMSGRRTEDLYALMLAMRELLGLRPLAAVRAEAVRTYGHRLACGHDEPLPYAAGVSQLFRNPEGDGAVIRLASETPCQIHLTPDAMIVEEPTTTAQWPLDRLIDLRVEGDTEANWLLVSAVGDDGTRHLLCLATQELHELRRIILRVLRMHDRAMVHDLWGHE